jgi:hypothetical protein
MSHGFHTDFHDSHHTTLDLHPTSIDAHHDHLTICGDGSLTTHPLPSPFDHVTTTIEAHGCITHTNNGNWEFTGSNGHGHPDINAHGGYEWSNP